MVKKKSGGRKGGANLGAALMNKQQRAKATARQAYKDNQADESAIQSLGFSTIGGTTKSITETGDLEAFLADAVMSGRKFEALRATKVIDMDAIDEEGPGGQYGLDEEEQDEDMKMFSFRDLPIPRRPAWTREMTAEELEEKERQSFLRWRKNIATLEHQNPGLHLTPFEKNIDYWRQLWRVVERSDIVVQVVDARNPLLFRCPDVESFVKSTGEYKLNVLLINKADFLTPELRKSWMEYFQENNIKFLFFSAKQEQDKLNDKTKQDETDEDSNDIENNTSDNETLDDIVHSTDSLYSRKQLLNTLSRLAKAAKRSKKDDDKPDHQATVGMIGYPNVGKSSVINVLLGVTSTDHQTVRVSVAATPGHTKHFQTLQLSPDTILCDCPGLVFPTFMSTKADMLCNGILPIDEIKGRDFVPAVEIVARSLPKSVFEQTYSMEFPVSSNVTTLSATTLIEAFCEKRGYMGSGHGRYNEAYGARVLLKDFVAGKLLYARPPPDHPLNALVPSNEETNEEPSEDDPTSASNNIDFEQLLNDELHMQEEFEQNEAANEGSASQNDDKKHKKKKKQGGKGRRNRHMDPYGTGNVYGANIKGKAPIQK